MITIMSPNNIPRLAANAMLYYHVSYSLHPTMTLMAGPSAATLSGHLQIQLSCQNFSVAAAAADLHTRREFPLRCAAQHDALSRPARCLGRPEAPQRDSQGVAGGPKHVSSRFPPLLVIQEIAQLIRLRPAAPFPWANTGPSRATSSSSGRIT